MYKLVRLVAINLTMSGTSKETNPRQFSLLIKYEHSENLLSAIFPSSKVFPTLKLSPLIAHRGLVLVPLKVLQIGHSTYIEEKESSANIKLHV